MSFSQERAIIALGLESFREILNRLYVKNGQQFTNKNWQKPNTLQRALPQWKTDKVLLPFRKQWTIQEMLHTLIYN